MITVKNNNVGTSARKVRQVVDLVRKKKVEEALKILRFCEKKETAIVVTKLINSGLAIAADSKKYDLDNLIINMIKVDEGPALKRIMPRAQGRAYRISKKSSYITLTLSEA
jgi:large subunit ribosomal protein L22